MDEALVGKWGGGGGGGGGGRENSMEISRVTGYMRYFDQGFFILLLGNWGGWPEGGGDLE